MKQNLLQTVGLTLLLMGCTAPVNQDSIDANKARKSIDLKPQAELAPALAADHSASNGVQDGRVSGEFRDSSFRPGLKVYFVYNQELEQPYSSSWWAALEKRNGNWIDIYFETNEKITDNGIISFKCSGIGDVGILSYFNEWANADNKTLYIIKPSMIANWKNDSLPFENSPQLPFEVFDKIKGKFC